MYYFYYAHLARRYLITGREYMGLCENINLVSDWIGLNCVEDFVFHRKWFHFYRSGLSDHILIIQIKASHTLNSCHMETCPLHHQPTGQLWL